MLQVEDLTFAYPGQTTPYRFNLSLAPGRIVAISGASGSGKSTLLDLIAGFQKPISGQLTWKGDTLLALPPEARPVSILFQTDNLFDHLSVIENLKLGLSSKLADTEVGPLIVKALQEVDLSEFGSRQAARLSGGQKQRVALARTLLRNRPILLLDEPFSALDPATADTMRSLVKTLAQEKNWTVIIVSHDPDDAIALADERYEMKEGGLSPAS